MPSPLQTTRSGREAKLLDTAGQRAVYCHCGALMSAEVPLADPARPGTGTVAAWLLDLPFDSRGLAAGIDLCVQLVRADHGSDAAISVARYMVVAPHCEGGQAQLLQRPVPSTGESLAATCTGRWRTRLSR